MSTSDNNSSSTGTSFTGLLTIVFITLKLTGFIDWSWWWVLAPIWISFAVWVLIIAGFLVIRITVDRGL